MHHIVNCSCSCEYSFYAFLLYSIRYRNNMKIVSGILKDRPMSPVEVGVYWTEFVLRHEHTRSLKPLQHLPWYKRRNLDILFLLFAISTATIFLSVLIAVAILKRVLKACTCQSVLDAKNCSDRFHRLPQKILAGMSHDKCVK